MITLLWLSAYLTIHLCEDLLKSVPIHYLIHKFFQCATNLPPTQCSNELIFPPYFAHVTSNQHRATMGRQPSPLLYYRRQYKAVYAAILVHSFPIARPDMTGPSLRMTLSIN